ncbi:thioredoxin family protein [Flavobacteriaceae bacterium S0825]|uniref:thioredoxin family protein n=1 Tax=Gaetbulibacter sp. S0825 TaxID=2720084 RepID=UPI00142F89E0|nr:thioredoxin family protein [Gaetbulibacter sp. S0825]MCK0107969.1 thioredoxin family protein [Flavobacteriaceae bacterium S0825]NIX63605.1 thioredoxin family protein [Gaetbulibacter sp. S0825]
MMNNHIIEESLKKAISYPKYTKLVEQLVEEKSTTGDSKTEALIEYTKLNDRRMKRWDKTLKIPVNLEEKIISIDSRATWLVITESWCGDAAHVMPVINKVAELNKNINFKVVLRDENEALMNQFLTNGSKSIPKLIMIDDTTNEIVSTYGPRPNTVTQMVNDFKKKHGVLTADFKQDLQVWYNKDKGQSTLEDLTELLCELQPSSCL